MVTLYIEREIMDMLYIWGYISKKGAWITSDEEFIEMLKDKIDFPEKIQGEPKLNSFLEEKPKCWRVFN